MYNYFIVIGKIEKIIDNSVVLSTGNDIVQVYLKDISLEDCLDKLNKCTVLGVKGHISSEEQSLKLIGDRITFF